MTNTTIATVKFMGHISEHEIGLPDGMTDVEEIQEFCQETLSKLTPDIVVLSVRV